MSASKLTKLMIIGLTSLPLICAQADEATKESADETPEFEAAIFSSEIVDDGQDASTCKTDVSDERIDDEMADDGGEADETKIECDHVADNVETEIPFDLDQVKRNNEDNPEIFYMLGASVGGTDSVGAADGEQAESESGRAQLSDSDTDVRSQEAQPMSSITEESSAPARFTSPVAEKFTIEFQY